MDGAEGRSTVNLTALTRAVYSIYRPESGELGELKSDGNLVSSNLIR